MKKLINQLSKKELKNFLLQIVLLGMCACTGNNLPSDNNQSIDRQLLIDTTGVIPVINGKPTNSGVYIHNLSNVAISNISYHILNTSNDYKLNLDDEKNCSEVAAGASCLIKFTTSELKPGNSASALLIAKYDNKQSKQLINYQYIDSHNYHGISFTNPLIHLDRSHPYATTYAFNPQATQSDTDSIELDNDSIQLINGAKNNTLNIEANQVLPIEFKLADIIKDKQTSIYLANNKDQPIMRVLVSPENKANILFSNPEVLELKKTDTAMITLYNNGSTAATNLHLDVDNANKLTVKPSGENDCINGGSLAAGASCNYQVMVIDKNKTDIRSLFFSYNDGIDEINETLNLAYISEDKAPSLRIAAETSRLYIDGGTSSKVKFILNNIGDIPFENMDIRLHSSLALSTITEDAAKSNCGKSLDAGSSCQITAEINAANYRNESGTIYLTADGDTSSKERRSYKFASLPLKVEVSDKTQLALTDFRPLDKATDIRTNSDIELIFNKPVDETTVVSPNVYLETTSGTRINLHLGLAINDQNISLVPDSTLAENTLYQIVLDQTTITDRNGKTFGKNSHYIAGSFTTGDFTAPAIIDFAPKKNAYVSITSPNIFVQFSEAMDVSTINSDSIYVFDKTSKIKIIDLIPIVESGESRVQMVLTNGKTLTAADSYSLIVDETRLKDKSGKAIGLRSSLELSSFYTDNGGAPVVQLSAVTSGQTQLAQGSGYENTDASGGRASSIRFDYSFYNQDESRAIDYIELSSQTKNLLQQTGLVLVSNECLKTIPAKTGCKITYRLPDLVKTESCSINLTQHPVDYNIYFNNKQSMVERNGPGYFKINVVNPSISIPDLKFQIKSADNTYVTIVFNDLYNTNLDTNDFTIDKSHRGKNCQTYDSVNKSQTCTLTLNKNDITGPTSLILNAWYSTISKKYAVSYSHNYEIGRLIYVTKGQWTGNLGGVSGADIKCKSEAPAGTTAKALLEMARPTVAGQRYFNIYGDSLGVALQDNAFRVGQTLESAIDVNNTASDNKVWFGSTTGNMDCSDWTVGGTQWGGEGDPSLSSSSWANSGRAQCGLTNRLYCVTQ